MMAEAHPLFATPGQQIAPSSAFLPEPAAGKLVRSMYRNN